jgi:hypothetical protein
MKTRLAELRAASNLGELVVGKPHPLKYKRLGEISFGLPFFMRLHIYFYTAKNFGLLMLKVNLMINKKLRLITL